VVLNLGVVLPLTAAAANLLVGTLHFALARAPGWRIARLYGGIALVAGLYCSLDIIYPIGGLSDAVYIATGRLSMLMGAVQGALWLLYAYSDSNGSVRSVPRAIRWVAFASLASGLLFTCSRWLMTGRINTVTVAWAGVSYHYPLTTAAGDVYDFLLLALPAWTVLRLGQRFRRGERYLAWQLALFAAALAFAIEEVLVANRIVNFLSLLDFGFLLLLVPLSWQVIDHVSKNARKLLDLSEHLKERTGELETANAQLRDEIAERERAGEALWESRMKLAAALASTTDAVLISDAQGHFVDFNDAFATFHRWRSKEECPQTLAGSSEILDVFLPDGAPAPLDMWAVARALRGEQVANAEYTLRRKDTGETWVGSYSFGPIFGNDRAILGSVVVGRDITEQKRAEEHLRHAQKLESIGVLAGGIAHDFNNLLTTILGNASLLKMQTLAETNERLTAIMESGERAAALTRQLLAYAGKSQFQITDFDVSRLVHSTTDLIRMSIPKSIDVELDVPRELPLVRGDSSQIQQVVMNLVINAAEAIGGQAGGRVTVTASTRDFDAASAGRVDSGLAPGRYICIAVHDNGCGMDEVTQAKIFDPFFTTKFTGRGLGLAAVHGILRSHQGAIQVESRPGRGSTFTVYLPSSAVPLAAAKDKGTGRAERRAATVLVADDEESIRALAKAALESFGHRVLLAEDGRQALSLLDRHAAVDLVLLDVIMPNAGGAEAFFEMRRRWPRLPILVVTGFSRYEAHQLGIPRDLPFLEKPYTIQMLAEAVDKTLQSGAETDPAIPARRPATTQQ
jgi:PAS domain S-box-containing protein